MEGRERDLSRGVGSGGLQRHDAAQLRISDQDRHQVAEVLRQAAGEGRIDLDELDERLEAAYGAKTYADLVPITADLPVPGARAAAVPLPRPAQGGDVLPAARHGGSFSMMGDCTRRGVWEISAQHTAVSIMGGVTLDLREARFEAQETVIDACAIMAGIDIIVNPSTRVVVEGLGIMGDFSEARSKVALDAHPDSPIVRVRGFALMAGVSVKRKDMPGATRKRLGRS